MVRILEYLEVGTVPTDATQSFAYFGRSLFLQCHNGRGIESAQYFLVVACWMHRMCSRTPFRLDSESAPDAGSQGDQRHVAGDEGPLGASGGIEGARFFFRGKEVIGDK